MCCLRRTLLCLALPEALNQPIINRYNQTDSTPGPLSRHPLRFCSRAAPLLPKHPLRNRQHQRLGRGR